MLAETNKSSGIYVYPLQEPFLSLYRAKRTYEVQRIQLVLDCLENPATVMT